MEDGFLSSLSKLVTNIQRPDGLLLYLGLALFILGTINGPFDLSNPKLSWGITCLLGSMAWFYLSHSIAYVFDGEKSHGVVEWEKMFVGIVFLGCCAVFFYRQFTGIWLIPNAIAKHF